MWRLRGRVCRVFADLHRRSARQREPVQAGVGVYRRCRVQVLQQHQRSQQRYAAHVSQSPAPPPRPVGNRRINSAVKAMANRLH